VGSIFPISIRYGRSCQCSSGSSTCGRPGIHGRGPPVLLNWSSDVVPDWTFTEDQLLNTVSKQSGAKDAGKEVSLMVAIIALLAIVAFVALAALLGEESRDGNDWGTHPPTSSTLFS
jgi:hypothetical protein